MTARHTFSTKYRSDIVPELARKLADQHGITVGQLIENAVLDVAGKKPDPSAPIYDESVMLAQLGSALTNIQTAANKGDIAEVTRLALFGKKLVHERIKTHQASLATDAQTRSQTRWKEAGGVGAIPAYAPQNT